MKQLSRVRILIATCLLATLPLLSQTVVEEHWSPYDYPKEIPADVNVHIIVKGDTLWDIANQYYQDPFLWPQLYQANPYISDPDLIYPGDPIVLTIGAIVGDEALAQGDGTSGEGLEGDDGNLSELEEFSESSEEGDTVSDRSQTTSLLGTGIEMTIIPAGDRSDLECSTYIYKTDDPKAELPFDMTVSGGESEIQESYSVDEVIYINKGENEGIRPGDIYSIRRVVAPVYLPAKRHKERSFLGTAIDQIGLAKIVAVQETGSTAMVTHACDSILKGDFLVTYEQEPIPLITEQPPFDRFARFNKDEAGMIVFAEDQIHNMGIGHIANVNMGIASDVAPGDVFIVFRPNPHSDHKKNVILPDIYLGQAVTLKTYEDTSVVKISKGVSEIRVGDFAVPYRVAFQN